MNATMKPLTAALVSRYRVTHVLWHQGELDLMLGTDADFYRKYFLSFAASLRTQGIEAPIYISRATRCGPGWKVPNPVRTAQQQLLDSNSGLRTGIDTDLLLNAQDHTTTATSIIGETKTALAFAELRRLRTRRRSSKQMSNGDAVRLSFRSRMPFALSHPAQEAGPRSDPATGGCLEQPPVRSLCQFADTRWRAKPDGRVLKAGTHRRRLAPTVVQACQL